MIRLGVRTARSPQGPCPHPHSRPHVVAAQRLLTATLPTPWLEGGSRDPLKGWARQDTALADPESIDHPPVDVTGLRQDFRQTLQAPGHPEITGVVDDGLCDTRSHVASELAEEVRQMSRA